MFAKNIVEQEVKRDQRVKIVTEAKKTLVDSHSACVAHFPIKRHQTADKEKSKIEIVPGGERKKKKRHRQSTE